MKIRIVNGLMTIMLALMLIGAVDILNKGPEIMPNNSCGTCPKPAITEPEEGDIN